MSRRQSQDMARIPDRAWPKGKEGDAGDGGEGGSYSDAIILTEMDNFIFTFLEHRIKSVTDVVKRKDLYAQEFPLVQHYREQIQKTKQGEFRVTKVLEYT